MTNKIKTNKYSWTIPNVNYRNKVYTVELLKELLDNGKFHIQDEWAEYSNTHDVKVADMPLHHAIFTSIYNQKEEDIRKFIQKQMRDRVLMTLTRPIYKPRGKDKIVHNYHTPEEYTLEENLVGPGRFIEKEDSKALTALLGTGNVNEINKAYNYINQTNAYLFRLNSKPDHIIETVARFIADSDRANLGCIGNPQNSYSALGVSFVCEAPKNFPQEVYSIKEISKVLKQIGISGNLEKRILNKLKD